MPCMVLGLPHVEMIGWVVFIGPNIILAVGEKLLLSAAHRTVRCASLDLTPQVTVGATGFLKGN
jgi:hypothetical protein